MITLPEVGTIVLAFINPGLGQKLLKKLLKIFNDITLSPNTLVSKGLASFI